MLENLTARLRPRSEWEGMDLGIALARRDLHRLLGHWACVIFPFWVVLAVVLRNHPGWFFFIVWWLKPAFDRIPLFTLSRTLFGQSTRLRDVLASAHKLLLTGNFHYLTIARFSPYRSVTMPVKALEGGSYGAFRRRASALLRHGGSSGSWLTLSFGAVSLLAVLALYLLAESLAPNLAEFGFWELIGALMPWTRVELPNATLWLLNGFHLASLTFLEIYYVAGGFGIYLNSRTQLEGWDIEIAFRAMHERLRGALGVAAAIVILLAAAPPGRAQSHSPVMLENAALLQAADDASPKTLIKRIKAHKDFKVHSEERTVDTGGTTSPISTSNRFSLASDLGTIAFWSIVILAVIALIYAIVKNAHLFRRRPGEQKEDAPAASGPQTVMGLNVSPEALPSDIVKAAWERWLTGDARGALRLLYAGAISWMIQKAGLPVQESDTEGDCLRHAGTLQDPTRTGYFSTLTGAWINAAYGNITPAHGQMEQLIQHWPFAAFPRKA
jgi:hypothetical protein